MIICAILDANANNVAGHAGALLLSKKPPLSVSYDMGAMRPEPEGLPLSLQWDGGQIRRHPLRTEAGNMCDPSRPLSNKT